MPKSAKKTFLIVDGHALLHRAWHALPPLTTKDGLVIHGAYGFTTIMLGAIRQFQPAYMAVTFDLKGPTFRHEQYEDYKATREKKPDELYAQVDIIRKILDAMEIPVFTAKGYEADDVIGTLSFLAEESSPDIDSVIVTGDHDTLQLVDANTKVFTMRRGMSDTVLYDVKAVKERYGLKPLQLIDYKALRGDPSDNIPGVKGIGEKTGAELIGEFGSIEKLYASLDKDDKRAKALKPSVREKLIMHRKDAFAALDLCRIRRDVKIDFDLERCRFVPITREKMTPIFTELEFMKLLKQFPEESRKTAEASATAALFAPAEPSAPAAAGNVREIRDVKALSSALAALAKSPSAAFHFVTEDDDPVAPKSAALGLADAKNVYVIARAALRDGKPLIAKFVAGESQKICHDLKRERKAMAALGIVAGTGFFDLMIASYLLHSGERRHSLSAILAYERGVPIDEDKAPTVESKTARLAIELPHFVPLAAEFGKQLRENDLVKLNDDIELPLAAVLARMETDGIAIDVPYFKKLAAEVGAELSALTKKIHGVAGGEFNINSPAQLKVVLFEKLGISPTGLKKTEKGKTLSTAASELEKLKGSHPVVGDILRYRELAKLQSTYIEALPALAHPKTGRIHAEFNQTVTATGRLSSSNPNLQNIPTPETDYGKRVRSGFVAGKGSVLLAADYSQIELRIVAHIAKEKVMIKAFKDGEDIHWRTAAAMWGEAEAPSKRRIAKVINFGILYGMGAQRLAESADLSFGEARAYISQYFALHSGIAAYMEDMKEKIVRDGYVETLFGRKRFFRNVKFMNPRERAEAERQAINMPIQGTQADMIKLAMVRLDRHIAGKYGTGPDAPVKMLIQVHDELVFEVRKDLVEALAAEIAPIMEGVCKLAVPVVVNVSTGTRWGEMEKRA
ncbi:MAG TPA: DNA polymerase I [Patescibacteria group bacterium]|nr:DNA polymerase I [Patescibacteria group bacterium]